MGMVRQKATTTVIHTDTAMDNRSLFQLMSWMSPSYPIGAYTYSHGIEYAVEAGLLTSVEDLISWIDDILEYGSGKSDCILLATAYRAALDHDVETLKEIAETGHAFAPTKEISLETTQQGRAFIRVTSDAGPQSENLDALKAYWSGPVIHPVAIGIAAADYRLPLQETLTAYLHGFVSNLVSAAVRIVPLGQTDGQRAIASFAEKTGHVATYAMGATLDDLGSATLMVDWCSSLHETQYTRLFRS